MMPFRMCHVPVLISGSGANADVLRTGQPSRAVYGNEAEHGEQWGVSATCLTTQAGVDAMTLFLTRGIGGQWISRGYLTGPV